MDRKEGGGLGRKEAEKRKAKRPCLCRSPGLMCRHKLRAEEAGRDLQRKHMSLEKLSAAEAERLLSETQPALFL